MPTLYLTSINSLARRFTCCRAIPVLRPVAAKYNLLNEEKQLRKYPANQIERAKAAPIELKNLRVFRQPNTYLIQVSYRSSKPELAADVVNAIAASYADHLEQTKMSAWKNLGGYTAQRLSELKAEHGSRPRAILQQMERSLGMVDPEDKSNIVASRLQQLNLDYGRAMADRANKDAAYEAIRGGNPERHKRPHKPNRSRGLSSGATKHSRNFRISRRFMATAIPNTTARRRN